ncbi:hypothetical protein GS458_3168 [Geobacillus stearothermophilus]|nr:hypothetical protein GS458_3168 [Geobacillus stearothermophilus]
MAKSKTKKTLRRLKYIEVEGIDKSYLDACLLVNLDLEQLCDAFEDERQLLAKTNLNVLKLKKREVTKQELIREVSPHISSNYSLYNSFANINYKVLQMLEEQFTDLHSLSLEEKADYLYELVQEEEMRYSMYINWLRFHEQLHPRILEVFQQYGEKFEEETGIQLPPSFNVKREEKKEEKEDVLYKELTNIIHLLTNVRDQAKRESFKEQYEEKQKEVEQLRKQLSAVTDQLSSKEKQLAKQMKEAAKLEKKLEEEQQKVIQKQKEAGQLGQEVGKLRGQVEELTKKNKALQQEVESKSKQMSKLTKEIEERSENRWKLEKAKIQQTYEERVAQLEETVQQLQSQLEKSLQEFEQERTCYENELDILRRKVDIYEQMMNDQQNEKHQESDTAALISQKEEDSKSDEWFDSLFGDLPVNEPEKI